MISVSIRQRWDGFDLNADFEAPGGVTALFGRSGSGKTSVINAVAGLLRPEAGRIAVGGAVLMDSARGIWVPPHKRKLGYVFQEARLFPHLSVRQNLRYGRWMSGAARDPALEARLVEMLGLGDLLARRPGALSGGERQRVAIGRALLSAPRLLLMDEPLAALDAARKEDILPYLERLRDGADTPILYVSHAVSEIARLANTVVLIDAGQVRKTGPVQAVLSDPASVDLLGVRDAGAVLTGRIAAQHADGLTEMEISGGRLFLPGVSAGPGTALRVRIAAQDVMLARSRPADISALNILDGQIADLRMGAGPGALVQVAVGDDLLLARITRRSALTMGLAPGQPIVCIVKSVSVARRDLGAGAGGANTPD